MFYKRKLKKLINTYIILYMYIIIFSQIKKQKTNNFKKNILLGWNLTLDNFDFKFIYYYENG